MRVSLKAERLNRGLSIKQAPEKMGVAAPTLGRAEDGEGIHPNNALKIADFYGLKVTDIWPVKDKATV